MRFIRKHFLNLLLSCTFFMTFSSVLADLGSPLTPVYTVADDLSKAYIKPTILYKDVPGSKIEVTNMPAYKTQDTLGECRAFSLTTILQKYTCDNFTDEIKDCKNIPPEYEISSFGTMMYTHVKPDIPKSLSLSGDNYFSMYDILKNIKNKIGRLIPESCKPFSKLVNSFTTNGGVTPTDKKNYDNFIAKLKKMYETSRSNTEAGIEDCPECLNEMNNKAGLNINLDDLREALKKNSFEEFLYSTFFDNCTVKKFPALYEIKVYPTDEINATLQDMKNKILEGLKKGKPVLTPSVCLVKTESLCPKGNVHSMVVAAYKKVCEVGSINKCKELLRVHNSWGEEWQKANNDGWVDADLYVSNIGKLKSSNGYRFASGSVYWLE